MQFKRVVKHLSPAEIPRGYMLWCGTVANTAVALIGVLLIIYPTLGFG